MPYSGIIYYGRGGLENKYIKNKWHFKILETVFD